MFRWLDLTHVTGTGKSVLLREIIKTLRKIHVKTPDAVAITASTGDGHHNYGSLLMTDNKNITRYRCL